jgi:hypothetical protein
MRRTLFSTLAGSLCFFALAACSDNPNSIKAYSGKQANIITTTLTLDQSINAILDLFPREVREHDEDRRAHGDLSDLNPKLSWSFIKLTYQAGLTRPALMTLAKRELFWLSDWITRNAQLMNTPPNGETKAAAAARLVLYMNLYVYSGPLTAVPSYSSGADATVGTVTPTAPAVIVTPTGHAGVSLNSGSVTENTVIVVTQNPAVFAPNCSGPLTTKLCQYPQFYTFEMFPHRHLLKPAIFNVCHVNTPDSPRYPLANHDRFKLAHALPAAEADRTPGSIRREGPGENVELLAMVPQVPMDFSTCTNTVYASNARIGGPLGVLSRLAKGLQDLLSPKTAYAIDVGLGGISIDTSPFNDVDPDGRPDREVRSVSVSPATPQPSGTVSVSFSVANIGTATATPVPATIWLTSTGAGAPFPYDVALASVTVPAIVPGETFSQIISDIHIPPTLIPGSYNIRVVVGDDASFPDISLENNKGAATPFSYP